MAWEPEFIDDGEAADAPSVNLRLFDAESWLNDIDRAGLRRGAFNHFHAAQVVKASTAPLSASYDGTSNHTYPTATFSPSMTFASAGSDGGSDSAGVYTGDRTVIGHPDCAGYSGGRCMLTFDGSGYRIGMSNGDRVGGILVLLNVQTIAIEEGTPAPAAPPAQLLRPMFCIQYKCNASGTWRTLRRTERFWSHADHCIDRADETEKLDYDVCIATMLKPQDLTNEGFANTNFVTGVRGMVSLVDHGTNASITLRRWTLSAIPLHIKEM